MLINNIHLNEISSPNQIIKARVELYKGSTLEKTCTCNDVLSKFTVEKTGEGKFFGYGICSKLNAELIDLEREINISKENTTQIAFGVNDDYLYPFPTFYIDSVKRDETSNLLTIDAYDILYKAANHKVGELALQAPYTIRAFAEACASLLGVQMVVIDVNDDCFNTLFEEGVNFEGTETIRNALNAVAEVTQTIYYIDNNDKLTFKRLNVKDNALLTISKEQYIDLTNGGVQVLSKITHATELGDNISSVPTVEGVTQYVRNNPFWDLRDDTAELINKAQTAVGGTSINQFECNWIGNYLLEIGDKIGLIAEDDSTITSYVLNDTITYDGTLLQLTKWQYDENEAETASNPTSIGETISQTYARVDKANKQITLLVNEVNVNKSATDAELKTIKEKQTSITQTANDISLRVTSIEDDGVKRVDTGTGFTFNEEGLRINKDNSGIENLIDNTGMYVKQDGTAVLSANTEGVKAKDLHAVTYLWIGSHSRFEDYEGGRTGCFWIGE